ncbi:hypothetical protein CMI47_13320 [Candidatus Pacearchaeota archaeon]|nr:hypothetical protein [Candidatus Pacearchaeota archaeon]
MSNKSKCITNSIGTKRWYLNNKLHREDGPAILHQNGDKYWYLNGKLVTEAKHKQRTQVNIFVALHNKLKQETVI